VHQRRIGLILMLALPSSAAASAYDGLQPADVVVRVRHQVHGERGRRERIQQQHHH